MSYYQRHIFFCQNKRDPADGVCCAGRNAAAMLDYAKGRAKKLNLLGPGKVRINKAGCLDRCELGPVAVVYPEGVWYTYVDEEDIDEILESHLRDGKIVERLLLDRA